METIKNKEKKKMVEEMEVVQMEKSINGIQCLCIGGDL